MKRLLAALVLVALTAAGVYGYVETGRERTYRQLLIDGEGALARDNAYAAIEAFSGAILLKEDSMIGYLKRGEAYRRRGEYEAALRDLKRASELDPAAPRPLEELGDLNLGLKPAAGFGQAAQYYRDYLKLDDRSPRVLYKLAYARYNDGHPGEAIDALHRALAIDDHFAEASYLLGLCQRDARQLEPARRALLQAIDLQPTLYRAREELADLDVSLQRTDERLAQLEALSALDPGASREVTLGTAYAKAGQADRAILTLGRAAETYPDSPYIYVALGRVWLEIAQSRGDRVALSKALGALEDAVGRDNSSEAMTLFGRALLLAADPEGAERMLDDASRKEPADPLAFYYLADAAERLGHYGDARRALADYTALRGDDPDPRRRSAHAVRLADLSVRADDPAAAARYFLQAAVDSPEPEGLLTRAAEAQVRAGDRAAAAATIARILEREPTNAAALALARRLRHQ